MSRRAMFISQDLVVRALREHFHRSTASSTVQRAQLVDHLLDNGPARETADRFHLPLAPSYVVVGVTTGQQTSMTANATSLHSDILVGRRDENLLFLVPVAEGTSRGAAKSSAERKLGSVGVSSLRHEVRAFAIAFSPDEVSAAAGEVTALLRVTSAINCPPSMYGIEDLSIEMALLRSPDLSHLLAQRLAPLHRSGAPLVKTLQVYLANSQDRRKASNALFIHPNTLDYRLRRVMELTGLSARVPRDIQVLGAALVAWRLVSAENNEAVDGQLVAGEEVTASIGENSPQRRITPVRTERGEAS
jgi:sugar diacid utilization regulator